MVDASYKHPKKKKLIWARFAAERHAPSDIIWNGAIWYLYGMHKTEEPKIIKPPRDMGRRFREFYFRIFGNLEINDTMKSYYRFWEEARSYP